MIKGIADWLEKVSGVNVDRALERQYGCLLAWNCSNRGCFTYTMEAQMTTSWWIVLAVGILATVFGCVFAKHEKFGK